MSTVAVLGVGRVGAAIARTAVDAGHTVHVAGSGAPDDIELLTQIVIPGARAMTSTDAVRDADVVVIAVPLHKFRSVDPAPLDGKIVVDVMNYWAPIDGIINDFEDDPRSSSEIVADHFRGARLVKSFNHIGYHDLEEQRLPAGAAGRRALAVASDDEDAARRVMELIDGFGFDAIFSGPLASGAAFQPDTPIFTGSLSRPELARELDLAAGDPATNDLAAAEPADNDLAANDLRTR